MIVVLRYSEIVTKTTDLVNGTGNPRVSPAGPVPIPMSTGTGFVGTGDRFQQPGGKVN